MKGVLMRHLAAVAIVTALVCAAVADQGQDIRSILIVPGTWTAYFDEEPSPEVKTWYLQQYGKEMPLRAVDSVTINDQGLPVSGKSWLLGDFHWEGTYRHCEQMHDTRPMVALMPGHENRELVEAARSRPGVADWLRVHSVSSSTVGSSRHEDCIIGAIESSGRVTDIIGHSQAAPNILSSFARRPDLLTRLGREGCRVSLFNGAFRQSVPEIAASVGIAQVLKPDLANNAAMRELVRKDEAFTDHPYELKCGATHYLDFVREVAPQIGKLAEEAGVDFDVISTSDGLTDSRAAARIAVALGTRFVDARALYKTLGEWQLGNQGVFSGGTDSPQVWGNVVNDDYRIEPKTKLPHSPNDLRRRRPDKPTSDFFNDRPRSDLFNRYAVQSLQRPQVERRTVISSGGVLTEYWGSGHSAVRSLTAEAAKQGAHRVVLVGDSPATLRMSEELPPNWGKRMLSFDDWTTQGPQVARSYGADLVVGIRPRFPWNRHSPQDVRTSLEKRPDDDYPDLPPPPGGGGSSGRGEPPSGGGGGSIFGSRSPRVGGVLLSGRAQQPGPASANVSLSSGGFSLVVDGRDARLEPAMFQKFVTALWAVYFGRAHPGLSIDPICQDPETGDFSPKHMVRYMGGVMNTDLGRVMREADYIMKKWSIGTERPGISGFKTPDDYSGASGMLCSSLSRFWLTPENMRFREDDSILLFDGGRMAVRTEVLGSDSSRHRNPHNESFAAFFTQNYDKIATEYPVFQELEDYARLVALARYLKESGVPLLWFLLANRDQVLTEDSPGTVDNLARESAYWEGVSVQGGVNMEIPRRQFVYDADAMKAIADAQRQPEGHSEQITSVAAAKPLPDTESFSFGLGTNRYTVTPQHSLTCGKDGHGIRYQTDFCLRAEGYRATDAVVDLLQSELLRGEMRRLLQPVLQDVDNNEKAGAVLRDCYREASRRVEAQQQRIEELRGQTYASKHECFASWDTAVGEQASLDLRRLFVSRCHYISNLEVVRYFNPAMPENTAFGTGWRLLVPYSIRPQGDEKTELLNVLLPSCMELVNELTGETESFLLSESLSSVARYVPADTNRTQWVGIFPMTDATFHLADKLGSEFQFDASGRLSDMHFSENHHLHIEYLDDGPVALVEAPYSLEEVGDERVDIRGHKFPKRISVFHVANRTSEAFSFDDTKAVLGYSPEKGEGSAYAFIAVMTDGSYRLMSRQDNAVDFGRGGSFQGCLFGSRQDVVHSLSSGPHTVTFDYRLGSHGQILVAGARVTDSDRPTRSIEYQYDSEDRLCAVYRSDAEAQASVGFAGAMPTDGQLLAHSSRQFARQ